MFSGSVKVSKLEDLTSKLKELGITHFTMKGNKRLVKFQCETVEQFLQVLDLYEQYE